MQPDRDGPQARDDLAEDDWSEPVADPWSWVDAPRIEAEVDLSAFRVTAVLVTGNAERWLPETLAGLAALEHRPERLVAIDTGSTDGTRELLDEARLTGDLDAVIEGLAGAGFGAAVERALDEPADPTVIADTTIPVGADHLADPAGPAGPESQRAPTAREDWLWLLHDDAVVAPDALTRLLRHVAGDRSVAVTGPKLLRPAQPRGARARTAEAPVQLSEIGVSIAGTGRRDGVLEPGEVDQGQHDEPREVLGVSTCGLLVRRDVWDRLGGLTPTLPTFRDGVDFGWRAWLAGYRVLTTPSSVVVHRQVGHAGLRPAGAAGRHPARFDRALGLHVVLGHASGPRRPLVWARLVWGCVLRTLGYLIGKAPGRSVDELAALWSFVRHPGRTAGVRRRVRAVATGPDHLRTANRLRPPWWSSFAVGANRAGRALAERSGDRQADRDLGSLDAMTSDEFAGTENRAPAWRSPTLATMVVAVLLALIAARSLWRAGSLAAPALLPSGSGFWQRWLQPIPGTSATAPPWLGLVALLSSVIRPEPVVTGLICGMAPLAFLAAQPLLRALTDDRRVRWWGGITWAILPPVLGAENQGRLALGVLAIVLPLLGLAVRRLVRRPGLRGAWASGLALGVATMVLPVLFGPALLGAVIGSLVALIGRRPVAARERVALIGRMGLAVAVPVLLWAPWWSSLLSAGYPGRLVFGPDPALLAAQTTSAPAPWLLMLGRAGGPGLPPLWVSAAVVGAVWAVALLAIAVAPSRRTVLLGWCGALLAIGTAIAVSRLVLAVPPLGVMARPWAGGLLLLALGGLLLAGVAGLPEAAAAVSRRSFGAIQPLSVLGAVVVVCAGLLGAGWFVWGGAAGPVHRTTLSAIPPYIIDAQSHSGTRTLAITMHGTDVTWSVIDDNQLRLGDAERGYAFGGSRAALNQADDVTRRLVGGSADEDIAGDLTRLGIQYVWVSGADKAQQTVIGTTPGLAVASGAGDVPVWRLDQPTGAALIMTGGSTTPLGPSPGLRPQSGTARVPPGEPGRVLLLTEPADSRWQATLDGVPLEPTSGSAVGATWQQAYHLGAAGGELHWQLRTGVRPLVFAIADGVALLLLIILALPALRPESRHPTTAARRAAVVSRSDRTTRSDDEEEAW